MDYISTKFGVDSLSRFPFRTWTNIQTNRQTDTTYHLTYASATAGVGKI